MYFRSLKQNHNQTMWVDKNVRPVKVNMLQRKRNSEDGPSMATLMKQARLSVKVI